jgi:hypothetical protein
MYTFTPYPIELQRLGVDGGIAELTGKLGGPSEAAVYATCRLYTYIYIYIYII